MSRVSKNIFSSVICGKNFFGASLDKSRRLLFVAISRRKEKNVAGYFAETLVPIAGSCDAVAGDISIPEE